MKLHLDSFSSKFYRFFYETTQMPKNLCPYFWKLVLAWTLTIMFGVPITVFLLPILVISIFNKDVRETLKENRYAAAVAGFIIEFVIFSFFSIPVFLLTMFGYIEYVKDTFLGRYAIGGGFVLTFSILFGLYFAIKYVAGKVKKGKHDIKKPSIVKEFIKAKYNRYCPKIDWE